MGRFKLGSMVWVNRQGDDFVPGDVLAYDNTGRLVRADSNSPSLLAKALVLVVTSGAMLLGYSGFYHFADGLPDNIVSGLGGNGPGTILFLGVLVDTHNLAVNANNGGVVSQEVLTVVDVTNSLVLFQPSAAISLAPPLPLIWQFGPVTIGAAAKYFTNVVSDTESDVQILLPPASYGFKLNSWYVHAADPPGTGKEIDIALRVNGTQGDILGLVNTDVQNNNTLPDGGLVFYNGDLLSFHVNPTGGPVDTKICINVVFSI